MLPARTCLRCLLLSSLFQEVDEAKTVLICPDHRGGVQKRGRGVELRRWKLGSVGESIILLVVEFLSPYLQHTCRSSRWAI